jgi:hypothetical protein
MKDNPRNLASLTVSRSFPQNKAEGIKEITLTRAVGTHNHIETGGKLYYREVCEGFKALENYGL